MPPIRRGPWARHKAEEPSIPTEGVSEIMLWQARKSGTLRLVARNLKELPSTVYNIYSMKKEASLDMKDSDRWWECEALTKMDVSSNYLTVISEDLALLNHLTYLDVHDNQLESLPLAIGQLEQLSTLIASYNQLSCVPSGVFNEKSPLAHLSFAHNTLTYLPSEIHFLSRLQKLDLSHNQLTSLPNELVNMPGMRHLDVSHNKLMSLPANAQGLTALIEIIASHNNISVLDASWGTLPAIERIELNFNEIASLPLFSSPFLKELCVGDNKLRDIVCGSLIGAPQLQVLDIRHNKLSLVPQDCLRLAALERLTLSDNDITALPAELCLLKELKVLMLEGNAIRGIRQEVLTGGTVALLRYLETRIEKDTSNANGNKTQSTGSTLGAGPKKIDYSRQNANVIPESVFNRDDLNQVKEVVVAGNALTELPSQLQACTELEHLDGSINQLSCLPDLPLFRHLTVLDLARNCLTSFDFPTSTYSGPSMFPALQQISLSQNRLTVFPAVLALCPLLTAIHLDNNRITTVEGEVCRQLATLENIQALDLSNNDIMQVPPELGLVQHLRSLKLEGNTFRVPRQAILAKGTAAVLDWLTNSIQ